MAEPTPVVEPFLHVGTSAYAYLVVDSGARHAVVIDPVLDFDRRSGEIATGAADAIVARVRELGITVDWILETHAHADHLSAAAYLKRRLGSPVATGRDICGVQKVAVELFDLGPSYPVDGSQFDRLLSDGERLQFGGLDCEVIATPGHTPDSVTYRVGANLFVGDTLFLPDVGTARCDFPGAPRSSTSPCSGCTACLQAPASSSATTIRPQNVRSYMIDLDSDETIQCASAGAPERGGVRGVQGSARPDVAAAGAVLLCAARERERGAPAAGSGECLGEAREGAG